MGPYAAGPKIGTGLGFDITFFMASDSDNLEKIFGIINNLYVKHD